ncbi:MAG: AgmX/PglI C-terminal domain-containing protein [Deltaproteobacteria bacterium]|nr:AgmX/PglI C-terminal domain-containing protein [Deltaproteobacteria bacterium]
MKLAKPSAFSSKKRPEAKRHRALGYCLQNALPQFSSCEVLFSRVQADDEEKAFVAQNRETGQRGGKGMTRIRPGKVTYKGGLSREEIQSVIKKRLFEITFCYNKALAKDPRLAGKLVAAFRISPSGFVDKAEVRDVSFGSVQAKQCVESIVYDSKFPPPKGGGDVFVNYPFVFDARQSH